MLQNDLTKAKQIFKRWLRWNCTFRKFLWVEGYVSCKWVMNITHFLRVHTFIFLKSTIIRVALTIIEIHIFLNSLMRSPKFSSTKPLRSQSSGQFRKQLSSEKFTFRRSRSWLLQICQVPYFPLWRIPRSYKEATSSPNKLPICKLPIPPDM